MSLRRSLVRGAPGEVCAAVSGDRCMVPVLAPWQGSGPWQPLHLQPACVSPGSIPERDHYPQALPAAEVRRAQ